MRTELPRGAPRVSPTLVWGLGAGLTIVAVDTLTMVVSGAAASIAETVQLVDLLVNIAILSFVGLRVGRATGMVRSAAEAGVIAGLLGGLAGIALLFYTRSTATPAIVPPTQELVQLLALNVAMGGVIAWVNGFLGVRSRDSGSGAMRRR